jgi:hypothetical protein
LLWPARETMWSEKPLLPGWNVLNIIVDSF